MSDTETPEKTEKTEKPVIEILDEEQEFVIKTEINNEVIEPVLKDINEKVLISEEVERVANRVKEENISIDEINSLFDSSLATSETTSSLTILCEGIGVSKRVPASRSLWKSGLLS